jgi:hypothetical protein
MTREQAIQLARKRAKETDEIRFVVWDCGEYHVASDFDLDTWFVGISDRNILYCTADGEL